MFCSRSSDFPCRCDNRLSAAKCRSTSSRRSIAVCTLNIDGLPVQVNRKPIKNMYLRVTPPHGDVIISAPTRLSDEQIADFVRQRRAWIVRQRQRMEEMRQKSCKSVEEKWSEERHQQAAETINAQLPALLAHWEPIIGRAPTHITLRTMSTRWGSCTPRTGRIRLNLQLGLMEPQFLEYVLVHEMTHLWASGHGEEFQRRMSEYLPNWRALRRELNQHNVL